MRLLFLIVLLAACDACESAPEPVQLSAEAPPGQSEVEAEAEAEAEASEPPLTEEERLARQIDPDGFSRVRAQVTVGPRTFFVVQRDLMAAGMAAVDALPNTDAVLDSFDTLTGGCLGLAHRAVLPCMADVAPDLSLVLENTAERGSSWSVVAIEGDVVARRTLVALSVHQETSDGLSEPSIHAEDIDGDSKMELMVDLPVKPLRDDVLFTWGSQEDGSVVYVLDEALEIQARWTGSWSVFDVLDDGDSPPRSIQCSVDHEEGADHSLVLTETCQDDAGEEDVSTQVCRYNAGTDRYRCPPDFANQLFASGREWGRHYVAETEAEFARVLPLGGGFVLSPSAAGDEPGEPASDSTTRADTPTTPTPPAAPSVADEGEACTHIVQEPSPPLHVREEPNSRAPIAGDLDNGARITLTGRRGRWGRIESPVSGWVWTADLQPCPP